MGQTVPDWTGHISAEVLESMSMENKVVPEQELCGKLNRCYACKDTSHSLDQCSRKYKLVTVAHEFGYATEYPFIMIHPSEEMLEKEKFYHHCLLITSDVSNLDLGILKVQLQKLWNLPAGSWVLRRECSKSFLASLSSEGDLVRCLKNPNMEMLMDDKEVKLTVTRWSEGEDESNGLIKQWFLVCGIPRKYRGWAELYQVVSMFGVLIDVDEGSLQVGDKEPVRLKIALRNHDGAPLSSNYVVGWSSRMAMLTVEAKIDSENKDHNTSIVTSTGSNVLDFGDISEKEKEVINASQSILLEQLMCINESRLDGKTTENKISTPAATVNSSKETTTVESSKPEGVQSICQNSTSMIGEDHFKGIPKPSIKYVFKRRGKKQQQVTESTNRRPSNKPDNGIGLESSNATWIGVSEMEGKRGLNVEEIAPMGVCKESETCMEKEDNSATLAATIDFKEKKISENSSKTERAPSVTVHTKVIVPRDEEVEACTEKEDNGATTNSKEKKISENSSKTERAQSVTARTKVIVQTDEEVEACTEKEDSGVTLSATTNSKEKKISENSSKTERAQSVTAHTKVIVLRDEELKDIKQYYIYVKVAEGEMKLSKLYDLLKIGKVVKNVIIFVNTKDKVMSLAEDVGKHYNVSATHDGMDQHARDAAIQRFRSGSSSILIADDLGGGGGGASALKVPIVINYDVPTQSMQYIQRVRQQIGEPGKKSVFVSLVTRADECVLFEIQRSCNGQVKEIIDM